MTTTATIPRHREIVSRCQSIRSHWDGAKRRERRDQARSKQRQLVAWLADGGIRVQSLAK